MPLWPGLGPQQRVRQVLIGGAVFCWREETWPADVGGSSGWEMECWQVVSGLLREGAGSAETKESMTEGQIHRIWRGWEAGLGKWGKLGKEYGWY